jgi:hypothetical protein
MTNSNNPDLQPEPSQSTNLSEFTVNSGKETATNMPESKAPFEDVLGKGIEKLTSEIFIFLLCHTILLN